MYKPGGQLVHIAAPVAEKDPAAHAEHATDPAMITNFPLGQVSHINALPDTEKVPTAHDWHVFRDTLKKFPGEHMDASSLA